MKMPNNPGKYEVLNKQCLQALNPGHKWSATRQKWPSKRGGH